ncbi:polysaccharide deacetylase family protein [Bdellovibrio sp. HCB290]|uniref:polysaccharide deacetylase family protein n=1 Tax=Bdellovibrio sp. HCB290 TaxID=3394356 RepID=UPI0039B41684
MKSIWFVLPLAITATISACTHVDSTKSEVRVPASSNLSSTLSSVLGHLSVEEAQPFVTVAEKQDSQRVRELLSGVRISQVLASSFDSRLAQISKEEDADKLMGSNLYCRILKMRPLQEHIEDKLRAVYAASLAQGRPTTEWFYEQLRAFAKVDAINEVAVIQMVRLLQQNEETYCGAKDCVVSQVSNWPEFHVAPFDDEAFAAYVKKNAAKYTKVTASDLKAGSCFGESRSPQQAGAYDWKNRNWVGSVLPAGKFVITYDDGPHATYTKQIRDIWSQAGLAKPAFFWLSKNVSALSGIAGELSAQGYVIGSHSVDHKDIGALARAGNTSALDYEINGGVATLSKAIGKPVHYFRLPYGSGVKNNAIGARFQALNVEHFFWRVDSLDWQDKNPASIRDRVVAQMKATGRGIVLFHDIHPQSAKASQLLVDYLKVHPEFAATSILDIPGMPKY